MADALAADDVQRRLAEVPGWEVADGKLHRELTFDDFVAAFSFMAGVALVAEKMNHHPDWSNSWNKVTFDVVSHAAGGITEQCFELASKINALAGGK
jgi:4a-hydroxytetrahydrobiopterin dehydratase